MAKKAPEPPVLLRESYFSRPTADCRLFAGGRTFAASERRLDTAYASHTHEFFELELILDGDGTQQLNGKEHPLGPGTLSYLTPVDLHAVSPLGTLVYYNVMFSEHLLPEDALPLSYAEGHGGQLTLAGEDLIFYTALFRRLVREKESDRVGEAILRCLLLDLLRRLPSERARPGSGIPAALLFLLRSFRDPITLSDAAAAAHMSPHYFCTLFRRETGVSFSGYLTALRLRAALRYLTSTSLSVVQICYLSGFRSISAFSRSFRRAHGMSPGEMRKKAVAATGGINAV